MTQTKPFHPRSALACVLGLGLALLPACGASAPPPLAAPPPATVAPAPPPAPPAAPSVVASTPAPAPAAVAPAPPKEVHGHGMAALLLSSLDSLELKPEQKTALGPIESELEKGADATKEVRAKLGADVAEGVSAGKLDRKKIDADIATLGTTVASAVPALQDAVNRLYQTLDAGQRKQLVETLHAKGKEMHEGMGMMGGHGMGMMGGHGMGMAEHDGKGPHGMGMAEHDGKGPPGMGMAEHDGKGPHGMGMAEHDGKGPPEHEHEHDGKAPAAAGMPAHPGMAEGPLLKLGEELALTPQQKDQLRLKLETQMKANHAAMKSKMEAAEKQLEAIGAAFTADKFDAKKAGVGVLAAEHAKLMATHRVQFVETVLSVLTPEQRVKFSEHVKAHVAQMEHGD